MMAAANESLVERHGATLLEVAATAIDYGLRQGREMPVDAAAYPPDLRTPGAAFVTLTIAGRLRGCIGSLEPFRPLVEDVAGNAHAAAFRDSRFDPVIADERPQLDYSVSVLAEPEELHFAGEPELLAQLHAGRDGLIIRSRGRRALFLPQVWETLPEPEAFLYHLKAKAGLDAGRPADLDAWRFTVESVSSAGSSG